MSEKQFEECSLEQATHIEVGGKVYELGNGFTSKQEILKYNDSHIDVCRRNFAWQLIHVDAFPILGIKPMREKKREPVVFEATFAKYDGKWHPLYSLDYGFPVQKYKTATFKCVEILEEKK